MAGNPIKESDLVKRDGTLRKILDEIIELMELQRQLEANRDKEIKKSKDLEKSLKKLNPTQSKHRSEIEKTAKEADEITKRYQKLNDSMGENALKITALQAAQQRQNQFNKLQAKFLNSAPGSYDKLSAQYGLAKIKLNAMSDAEREGTQAGRELEAQSNNLYQEMKRLQEQTGKHVLSVGDYAKGIRNASKDQRRLVKELEETKEAFETAKKSTDTSADALKAYENQIEDLTEQIKNLGKITGQTAADFEEAEAASDSFFDRLSDAPGPIGQVTKGIKGIGDAGKALLNNPMVLFLAAIAAIAVTLFSAFVKSERGAKLLDQAGAVLSGTMSFLVNVAGKIGASISNAFENPKEAVISLGETLKDQIVNRLKSLPAFVGAIMDAVSAAWNGKWEEMKDAGKDALFAVNQAITGLDKEQVENFADSLSSAVDEMLETIDVFVALAAERRRIRNQNRALIKSIEELTTAEALHNLVAGDGTRSFKEQKEAAEAARIALEQKSKKEIQIARNNLSLINSEIDIRKKNGEDVEDLLDQQLEGYKELRGAEREYILAVKENEQTRAQIKQDELEKDLDILIDGFDNQKTINERRMADELLTLEQKRAILEETANLADASFAKQISTIQQFTGAALDADDLIAESDAVVLNQKIRNLGLSEIIEGRLLEIIRERRIANQDLADSEIELAEKTRDERLKTLEVNQDIAKADFELVKRTEEEKLQFVIDQKLEQLETIREANEQFKDILPPVDTSKLESSIRTLYSNLLREREKLGLETFDQQQNLAESEFDLLKSTELDKTKFRLKAEKERLEKILELNEKFTQDLSDTQIKILRNQIAKIENELGDARPDNVYDLLGFKLDDTERQAIGESTQFALDQVSSLFASRVEAADMELELADQKVSKAEAVLKEEQEKAKQGLNANVEAAQQQLEIEKDIQKKALDEKKKAEKAQRTFDTISQTGSLITASAKIWGQLGFPAAIPALAVMWGSFIAAKTRANKVAKQRLSKGAYKILDENGSHATDNDTYLGFQIKGKPAYAEKGEGIAVIPKTATRKYKNILPTLMESIRRGTLEEIVNAGNHRSDVSVRFSDYRPVHGTDTRNMERELTTIRKQGERTIIKTKDGYIEIYQNVKTRYRSHG